jgi:chromosomal replication initiator protein
MTNETPSLRDCWQAALEETQRRSPASFDQWFCGLQFDDLTDGVLSLRAANTFTRDWVLDHYLPPIVARVRELSGLSIQLAWTIGTIERPIATPSQTELPQRVVRPSSMRAPLPSSVPLTSGATSSSEGESLVSAGRGENDTASASVSGGGSGHPHRLSSGSIPPLPGTPLPPPPEGLNPKCTFENFVVGPSNQLAHAAAMAAAGSGDRRRYSPLFLCGSTGLGKTHLIQAIAHHVLQAAPHKRIVYISAERFTNEFISSIQHKRMDEFRRRYRQECDVLLVDDIQFLAGREQTQEEFFHTFNALHTSDKPIVMTSDKYPQHLERMEERLVSRFTWGLVADIQVPELETRVAIVRRKAEIEGLEIADEVAVYLAQAVRSNVRELEGTLIRMAAKSSLTGQPVDLEFAKRELSAILPSRASVSTVEEIQRAVCHHFHLKSSDLLSTDRHKSKAFARHVAMYLCKQRLSVSFPELGRAFGKDHTTVMSAVRKVESLRDTSAEVRAHLEAIERKLASGD